MSELNIDYLIGIHHYFNPFPEEERGAAYYLIYLLDQRGILDKDEALKIFKEQFPSEAAKLKWLGPFESLDKLNQFAFTLCEKLDAQKISLISVQDYNGLLEQTVQSTDFHRDLLQKGNILENIDKKEKGFFKKLFR
jgi:acetylglutamate kinase